MSWRIVEITKRAKLDCKLNYLVIRSDETVKIHLSEIYLLLIESTAVSLTAALLCELNKRKIKVIFCDEKRSPDTQLMPYYGSHDISDKVRRQIAWSADLKCAVWTEIVTEKIRQQATLLEELLDYMRIFREYLGTKLFVLYNVKAVVEKSELEALCQELFYRKIPILLVQSTETYRLSNEIQWILDNDLCEIY